MGNSIGSGLGNNIVSVSFINQPFPNGGGLQGTTEQPTTTSSTTEQPTTTILCEPVSVNGYFPLYTSEQCAIQEGNGTFHSHNLNGTLYFMPNGVEYWHGNYSTTTTSTTGEPTTSTSSTTEEPTTSTSTTLQPEYLNQDGFAGFRVNQFFNRDGELWSLGSNAENTFAELGFGFGVNPSDQGEASQTGMTDVEFIAGGGNRLYVIKDDGSVWAVGRNSNGELGDGTQETAFDFIKIFDGEDKNYVTTTSTTSTTEEPTTSTSTTEEPTTSTSSTTEEPTTSTSTSTTEEPTTSSTSTTEEPTTSSTTEEPNSSLDALDLIPESMTLWLDASDLTSTPTLWSDKSGNDRYSSLVADINPSIVSNENGLSMMRFTDPGQKYIWTELNDIRTVFWVTKEDADAQIANGSTEFRFLLNDHVQRQENGQNTNPDFHNHRDNDFFWRTNVTDPNILNGTTRLNGSIIDGISTNIPTNLSVISLKMNGNVFASSFGYDRHVKSRQWLGDLAELIICNQELSDSDVQKVEGYLAHKWGLSDDLPGSHPYKNNSPTTEEPTTSTSTTSTTTEAPVLGYVEDPDFSWSDYNNGFEAQDIIFLQPYTTGRTGVTLNYPIGYRFWTTGSGGTNADGIPNLIRAEDPLRPRTRPYDTSFENQDSGAWNWFNSSNRGIQWEFAKPVNSSFEFTLVNNPGDYLPRQLHHKIETGDGAGFYELTYDGLTKKAKSTWWVRIADLDGIPVTSGEERSWINVSYQQTDMIWNKLILTPSINHDPSTNVPADERITQIIIGSTDSYDVVSESALVNSDRYVRT